MIWTTWCWCVLVNTWRLKQNGCWFTDNICEWIFSFENLCILFEFHWSLFLCVQLKISTIGLDNGLASNRRQAIIWTNDGCIRHTASLSYEKQVCLPPSTLNSSKRGVVIYNDYGHTGIQNTWLTETWLDRFAPLSWEQRVLKCWFTVTSLDNIVPTNGQGKVQAGNFTTWWVF